MTHARRLIERLTVWLAEEKRNGRRLASEAEALREWVRLQKAQLQKLEKRKSNRARLKRIMPRLAARKAALAEWDEGSPPEVRSHCLARFRLRVSNQIIHRVILIF